jgi:calcium-dependent protein kinase
VISKEAKSLITRMLKRNPRNRISAKEALQDPWIISNVSSQPLKEKIFKNLTTFSVHSRFRHAIITFIASQMATKEDNQEMLEAFASLDTDGNGVLSKQELLTGYALFMPDSN